MPTPSGASDSALRALHAAADEIATLRAGDAHPDALRGYILRVANCLDRSLRRLLRDDESADLTIRLRALATDEMESDEVLAELRRSERLSMSAGAAVHDLFELRARLERGGVAGPDDARRTVAAVDRIEPEIARAPEPAYVAAQPLPDVLFDETLEAPRPSRRRSYRSSTPPVWAIGGAVLLVIVAIGAWALMNRDPGHLDQGIALFRTGEYADAAHHFWRFSEANPDDPTPHLYLARIHRRMERPELAAEAIREAQRLAPEDPAVHRELGFLLIDTGQPGVAVDRFRTAIEMEPESSEGWVGLVRALRESGRGAEVEQAMRDAPAEARALLLRPGGA